MITEWPSKSTNQLIRHLSCQNNSYLEQVTKGLNMSRFAPDAKIKMNVSATVLQGKGRRAS